MVTHLFKFLLSFPSANNYIAVKLQFLRYFSFEGGSSCKFETIEERKASSNFYAIYEILEILVL